MSAIPSASAAGRLFALAALLEACTWAGLLAGMWVKYGTTAGDLGVRVFGPLHGAAFLLYLGATLFAAPRLRWPWWAALLAIAAAVPPLATLPVHLWFQRRGWLGARDEATRA